MFLFVLVVVLGYVVKTALSRSFHSAETDKRSPFSRSLTNRCVQVVAEPSEDCSRSIFNYVVAVRRLRDLITHSTRS